MVVLELDPEHGIGQGFNNLTLEFYRIFFGHCFYYTSYLKIQGRPRLAAHRSIMLPQALSGDVCGRITR